MGELEWLKILKEPERPVNRLTIDWILTPKRRLSRLLLDPITL